MPGSQKHQDEPAVQKIKILIVEDETIVALDMRIRLESLGYMVVGTAPSSETAIAYSKKSQPDLVLMDIKLQGELDGIETARRICKIRETPIIFVTAYTDEGTLEKVRAVSSYGFIIKPYHERELRIAIELALSKFKYEKKLLEAKEMAEENDRAKTLFLSNISHELKTPLNAIIGFTDLAAGLAENPELKEFIYMASRGARRLESSINSLLDYTKLESGSLIPVSSEYGIEDMLLRCWEPFAAEAYSKGLAISFSMDPALPPSAHGDASKLSQIIKNLLENAVKFTDAGSIRLCATREIQNAKTVMHLSVLDTGRGIPPEYRASLFTSFTQVDVSYTRLVGGMGLGLCLVKGLTQLLGISLSSRENPGGGTIFDLFVDLPAEAPQAYPLNDKRFCDIKIGLLGLHPSVIADVQYMCSRLGAGVIALDAGVVGDTILDMIFIDVSAWLRSSPQSKNAYIAAARYGIRGMVIFSSPSDFNQSEREGTPQRLPYPVSLNMVYAALDRIVGDSAAERPTRTLNRLDFTDVRSTSPEAVAPVWRADSQGKPGSEYPRLYSDAKKEMTIRDDARKAMENLFLDIEDAYLNSDEEAIERITKRHYDDFSAREAKACAKFALAILLDARKGPGPWIRNLHALMHTSRGS